jgi:NAD(P)-dependent dehydrogenase (short-subunit alcohol dehydrogenase family)
MSSYVIEDFEFATLQDKVIVVTGGAKGIGRATVELAHGESYVLVI